MSREIGYWLGVRMGTVTRTVLQSPITPINHRLGAA